MIIACNLSAIQSCKTEMNLYENVTSSYLMIGFDRQRVHLLILQCRQSDSNRGTEVCVETERGKSTDRRNSNKFQLECQRMSL